MLNYFGIRSKANSMVRSTHARDRQNRYARAINRRTQRVGFKGLRRNEFVLKG